MDEENPQDVGRKGIRREVWRLAWPVIVANVLQTFTTIVDLIMVGTLGKEAVAAIGLGGQVLFFAMSMMIAVSAGTIALVARHTGAEEIEGANLALRQSILMGLLLSLPIMTVGLTFSREIIGVFGMTPTVTAQGALYVSTVFLAIPFLFTSFLSTAALRGAGDTKTPMLVGALINVVNFVVNYTLIFGNFGFPALGVQGAAIGTAISFGVGSAVYLVLFTNRRVRLEFPRGGALYDPRTMKRILRVGLPALAEQVTIQVGFLIYTALIVVYGVSNGTADSTAAVSAHFVGLRVESLAFMPGFGFAMAATALTGQNLGAKNAQAAERSALESARLSLITMGAIAIILFIGAEQISYVFIQDPEVISLAAVWIRIHGLTIPGIAIFFTLAGGLRGAGDTRWPMIASVLGIYVVRLPAAMLLGSSGLLDVAVVGVWLGLFADYYVRAAIIGWRFRSGRWKAVEV
jgi:putative MATE family efflux protein